VRGRVAIVKSAGRADPFADAVRGLGFTPVLVSPFRVEEIEDAASRLDAALAKGVKWLAVTSPHAAIPRLARAASCAARVAAVGEGTASALHALGCRVDLVGDAGAEALGRRIAATDLAPGDVVVHACGEDARQELRRVVEEAAATYLPVVVYRMVPDPVGERAAAGDFVAVVVGSPNLARRACDLFPRHPPAIAIGRTTAAALRDLGWSPAAVAATSSPSDVAAALASASP
jgi:uroporphyrinogen-III synthase